MFVVRPDGLVLLAASIGLALMSRDERNRTAVVAAVASFERLYAAGRFGAVHEGRTTWVHRRVAGPAA